MAKWNCCKDTCPTVADLPDIQFAGMTGGSWTNLGFNACCWQRTYTFNEEQPWEFITEELTTNLDQETTSVVEWLVLRQVPQQSYRLSLVPCPPPDPEPLASILQEGEPPLEDPDLPPPEEPPVDPPPDPDPDPDPPPPDPDPDPELCLEECPSTLPSYDCGTYVQAAVTTSYLLTQYKVRKQFYARQRDITVRISRGDVSCNPEEPEIKWVVQIQRRYWSRVTTSEWVYTQRTQNTVVNPCFSWTPSLGWANLSTTSGSQSWINIVPIDTERIWTKTKTYTELPETDTWLYSDPTPTDCYMICAFAGENTRTQLQAYQAPVYVNCSPTVVPYPLRPGYTLNPCIPPGFGLACSFVSCIYCETSPPTLTRVPGATIDCSGAGITSYVVSNLSNCTLMPSMAIDSGVFGIPRSRFEYICGDPCIEVGCPDIPSGWYQPYLQEKCYYGPRIDVFWGISGVASQVSLVHDYLNVTQQSLINYDWTPLLVDFNL